MTPQEIVNIINNPQISDDTAFYTLMEYLDENKLDESLLYIQEKFKCNNEIAKQALTLYKEQIYYECKKSMEKAISSLTPEQIAHNNAIAKELLNKPKCPTCSSTNLKEITITSKVFDTAMYGIFGTKRNKIFHCNNCGYEW